MLQIPTPACSPPTNEANASNRNVQLIRDWKEQLLVSWYYSGAIVILSVRNLRFEGVRLRENCAREKIDMNIYISKIEVIHTEKI